MATESFSLTWAPPRYPGRVEGGQGSYATVLDGDTPVGVVWLQSEPKAGAGVLWVKQTESIEKIRRHLEIAVEAGVSEMEAFNAIDLIEGVEVGVERHGDLSGVDELLESFDED